MNEPTSRTHGRLRRTAFTVVAALGTLLTALLSVGSVSELVAADKTAGERLALLAHLPWLTLGWCLTFALMTRRAERRPAALQEAGALLLSLYLVGLVFARQNDPVFYLGFGVLSALLLWLHPDRRAVLRPGAEGVSPLLLVLSLVLAGPLTVYAVRVSDLQGPVADGGAFYAGIAATAVAVPLLGLVASLRAAGSRQPGWTAAVMLVVLGVGSLLFDDAGALGTAGSVLALLGAVALAVVVEREARVVPAAVVAPVG